MRKLLLAGLAACLGTTAFGQITINEYAYDDGAADNFEFVELYNAGSTAVDLSNWVLDCGGSLPAGPPTNIDYTLPAGAIIPPGGYYVIGSSLVANVNFTPGAGTDLFQNDQEWILLRDALGNIVDGIAVETNKLGVMPQEVIDQVGPGIWGNQQSIEAGVSGADGYLTTNARYLDGLDTNNNGRDFGMRRGTPGATNTVVAAPTLPAMDDFSGFTPGDIYPNWAGWFRSPRVIDPTLVSTENVSAIPSSPDGGNALIAWDFAGGGNAVISDYVFEGDAGFEAWVYLETALTTGTAVESWAIGILGTPDMVYNIPFIANPSATGITGPAWVYNRNSTVATLRLVDAKDGGNSGGATPYWNVIATIDLTAEAITSGWYRLRIAVTDGRMIGHFSGDHGDPLTGRAWSAPTATGLIGGLYSGYRETLTGTTGTRAVTLDKLSLFRPRAGDVNGDGIVNLDDFLILASGYETQVGDSGYNANADFNGDGFVNLDDFLILAANYEG